ncbi:MAG: DeoR/GlpR transcriptional regulator [Firmicutes bacterium HGW-Firmicutes-1]|jgi:DeoR family fructose operon transcriptional repressor|nr:MAG: DeoR/GlpR transcriptional regulator [Firmicutes bacterium HGW-Firmicutes-1]
MANEKIFVDERKQLIVELLNKEMKKTVADLCDHFSVSPATMRSDLRELETIGLLKRTHGGAISNKKMIYEPNSYEKEIENIDMKKQIASKAIDYVQDDDVIILDTGSTTYELAKLLPTKKNLTVITYDFKIANYLDENSDAIVIFLGGQLRRHFHCVIGPLAISSIKDLNADRAFLGANGISVSKGLSTPNLELATIKKEIIRISDEVIVLCDSTKFGKSSFAKFSEVLECDLIITDEMLGNESISKFADAGVDLEVSK